MSRSVQAYESVADCVDVVVAGQDDLVMSAAKHIASYTDTVHLLADAGQMPSSSTAEVRRFIAERDDSTEYFFRTISPQTLAALGRNCDEVYRPFHEGLKGLGATIRSEVARIESRVKPLIGTEVYAAGTYGSISSTGATVGMRYMMLTAGAWARSGTLRGEGIRFLQDGTPGLVLGSNKHDPPLTDWWHHAPSRNVKARRLFIPLRNPHEVKVRDRYDKLYAAVFRGVS